MAETFRTGKLARAEGTYRKGLAVTTDPRERWDPTTGRGTVFVDAGRFEAWLAAGVLVEDAAAEAEVHAPSAPDPRLPAPPADEPPAVTEESTAPAPTAGEEA